MISIDRAINILAERTYENRQDIRQKNLQRRHQVVDLYGVEYTALGDANNPAVIYVSISLDREYLERFQFKLRITPFVSTVGSLSIEASGTITPESLAIEPLTNNIVPNPHTHAFSGITVNQIPGITNTGTTSDDFTVVVFEPETDPSGVNGIDITPFLKAQYGGQWISGMGVYPSLKINKDYDILQVACDMEGLGLSAERDLLTKAGYKGIMVLSNAPFGVTLVNYLKYSHLNR